MSFVFSWCSQTYFCWLMEIKQRWYVLSVFVDGECVDYIQGNTLNAVLNGFSTYLSNKYIPLDKPSSIILKINRNVWKV